MHCIVFLSTDSAFLGLGRRWSRSSSEEESGFLASDSSFVHFGSIRNTNHSVEPTSPMDLYYYEVACHLS